MTSTDTLTSDRALDALSAALEHTEGIGLADLHAFAQEAAETPLSDAEKDKRCRTTIARALATLTNGGEDSDAAHQAIEEALTANASTGLASRAIDLGALLDSGVPEVEYLPGELGYRIAYAAGVTGFTGHPESGKTTTVSRLALDAIRSGRHVVYLDWEQGEAETVRRFAALGARSDELTDGMTYVPFPGPLDWDQLGTLWDQHPDAVGVFDSTRGILRTLGLDEDRAAEVGRFMDPLVEFTLSRGVPCLLIDHVAKAATDATGYARGSGDKLAAVQAQWFVKLVEPFSESEAGEIELVRWKARSGGLPRYHRFEVGDAKGKLTFRRLDFDASPRGRMDLAIVEFLKAQAEPCSLKVIEQAEQVKGTATKIRERVKALAADPAQPVVEVQHRFTYSAGLDRSTVHGLAI